MSDKKITFPHMGNSYIPISYLIKKITKKQVIVPTKITKKTEIQIFVIGMYNGVLSAKK